ncbi:hypothetical protein [Pseudomonas proteolytica]|uniref:hypothetical protein n=1 Tax=Pseudomonas proteolytica TaxID=219574 RepID=UPI00089BBE97|nr:hypothetical protein [Pseudomonas proteolytica]KAA8706083.1 hypothetical protein F4W61_02335 [Pseudomonas proteolytica]TWR83755.1 hypothetical protein FIV38_09385 [Pseudomonas proteolytica]SEE85174.1 hypothetical protein SAMN04490200_5817 [Pseudomonas proteolytica]
MPTQYKLKHPIFKFQEKKHADLMFENKLRISNIKDFRDSKYHKGQILDIGEGTAALKRHADTTNITIDNKFIFCSTSHFLSDSLFWAIRENKECCVMILDPEEFYKRITDAYQTNLVFDYGGTCKYVPSRTFSIDAHHTMNIGASTTEICTMKPLDYSTQMEHRAIWSPISLPNSDARYLDIEANVADLLIRMEFGKLSESEFHAGKTVTMTTHLKNGSKSIFTLNHPHAIHSPVIIEHNGLEMLAFKLLGNSLSGATVSGAHTGMIINELGSFGCANIIADIELIEFH